jgi:hypothetical protein
VILFARFQECKNQPYQPLQPLISRDGGKTWTEKGPWLPDGQELGYILDTGTDLWIAGQHYAEGPTSEPFIVLYRAHGDEWPQVDMDVHSPGSELLGLALEKKNGTLLAWVEHINWPSRMSGPVYLHQSVDGGRTWQTIKKVRRIPRSSPGLRFFKPLPMQRGSWRLSGAGHFPSVVEHQERDGKWYKVVGLPLPIQQTPRDCEE